MRRCSSRQRPSALPVEVAFGDVDAAHESRAAVDDGDLGVIAPVGARREPREAQRRADAHVDSGLAEPPDEPLREVPRTHGVVEQPHLHAGARLAHEDVGDGAADAVVGEDVVGEMDVASRPLQCADQGRESLAPVVELRHAVAVADARGAAVPQQPFDAGGRTAVRGSGPPHGFAVSGQQIEEAPSDRDEDDGQQPCGRYDGRPLVSQDVGCGGNRRRKVGEEEKIHDSVRFRGCSILCAKKIFGN